MSYAELVLVRGAREIALGRVDAGQRCDLTFVDDLLQLQLAVRRFGWSVRMVDAAAELRELVDLAGLRDQLE